MSTVNLDLFALWERTRLVTSLSNRALPTLPTPVAGDTWVLRDFFVDDTTPLRVRRFSGYTVETRFKAYGNNHVYATASASSEITPSPVEITRTNAGAYFGGIEKQKIKVYAVKGSIRLSFGTPGPLPHEGYYFTGTTAAIDLAGTAQDIADKINDLVFYFYNGSLTSSAKHRADFDSSEWSVVSIRLSGYSRTADYTEFTVEFGQLRTNGVDPWVQNIPLIGVDDSAVEYSSYGWNVSLPLTATDFADLLLPANGPAVLEILVGGSLFAQYQFTADPAATNAPAFTNGPPPNSAAVGSSYDFTYTASGFPVPSFSLTSGTLPPGLSLSSSGQLSGTPTVNGTYSGVVTATNTAGTATQAFSITVGGGGNPNPGGIAGPLAAYRDGNFTVLDRLDGVYPEYFEEWPGLVLWHIPYCIDLDNYVRPEIGSYEAPYGYFVKDTPFRYIGNNLVLFERMRHNIPGDANRVVSASKNYQAGNYTFTNGQLTDISIISFTRPIKATCYYHYALDDPGGLPVIPFIQIVPFLHSQQITDLGTGFPYRVFNGANLPDNNFGVSPIEGSVIVPIFGRLFCRKIING